MEEMSGTKVIPLFAGFDFEINFLKLKDLE
jgi:hypothetical protein